MEKCWTKKNSQLKHALNYLFMNTQKFIFILFLLSCFCMTCTSDYRAFGLKTMLIANRLTRCLNVYSLLCHCYFLPLDALTICAHLIAIFGLFLFLPFMRITSSKAIKICWTNLKTKRKAKEKHCCLVSANYKKKFIIKHLTMDTKHM